MSYLHVFSIDTGDGVSDVKFDLSGNLILSTSNSVIDPKVRHISALFFVHPYKSNSRYVSSTGKGISIFTDQNEKLFEPDPGNTNGVELLFRSDDHGVLKVQLNNSGMVIGSVGEFAKGCIADNTIPANSGSRTITTLMGSVEYSMKTEGDMIAIIRTVK